MHPFDLKTLLLARHASHMDQPRRYSHTVDSADAKFKSAALDTNDKFQFRFTEPGEYPYFCRMYPKMTGSVVVQV